MFLFASLPRFKHLEKEYICWFEDEEVKIGFSEIPDIRDKVINRQAMTKEQIKEAKKKPMYVDNYVEVYIEDKIECEAYLFTIYRGYDYDGASIPKIFTRLIGSKEDIRFKVASLIHDVLCENHCYIDDDRYFSTIILDKLLMISDTWGFTRWMMKHSVDNYQKLFGGW